MFFAVLGRVLRRAYLPVLVGWFLVLLGTWLVAPRFQEVAVDREFAFLPADTPSRRAEEVYARAFPEDRSPSNIVVVMHRAHDIPGPRKSDLKFIEKVLEPGLFQIAESMGGLADQPGPPDEPLFSAPAEEPGASATRVPAQPSRRSIIARIRTPLAPGAGALLVSPDGQEMLVVLELTTEFLSAENWQTIARVEELLRDLQQQGKVPQGVDLFLTGSAVIGRDHTHAQLESVRATEWLTVVLVIALLVLIYRAPLLALIPLATVFLGVQISLNLLAMLAQAGYITLFQGIQIYIIILAYGAGVDYCLFLTARYGEELEKGAATADAVAGAVAGVGPALVASAATVVCGIGMMLFAEFGKFRQAGLAIPFSLLVVLCATLTFSPSLLRLAGRWAFWPRRLAGPSAPGGGGPTGLVGAWEKVGQVLLRRPGTIWLGTVALMAPFAAVAAIGYNRLSYDPVGNLPASASSVAGTRVLQEHFPAGIMGPVTVLFVDPHTDFTSEQGRSVVGRLTERLRERADDLGITDIRSLTAPLGLTPPARRAFGGLGVSEEARREAVEAAAVQRYTTDLGGRAKVGTRLELVLTRSPFDHWNIEALDWIEQEIRSALDGETGRAAQLYLVGVTASVRDLAAVMQRDRRTIELLVLGSVFLILVVLLRGVVVPLYLLLSVLFSYFVTLGVSFAVFWSLDSNGFNGIDWKVAIFLFTILIAVGEDYNIFLITRVTEEGRRFGPLRGITEALARTGPIISSCGVIMAGTFASLLAGSLTEMKQLGFALPFGVLLDTFVVRPILVPTFLVLLRARLAVWGR